MQGPPGDTPSARFVPDAEPAVTQALAVVARALDEMGARATRPLLEAPPRPYRLRPLPGTPFGFYPIVLATAGFAGLEPEQAGRLLGAYLAAGGNALDVADTGDEDALQAIGEVLNGSGARDRVVLCAEVGTHPHLPGLSAARLTAAVERVLTALGTDRIEVLALAGHDRSTPIEETLTAAEALIAAGKVRALAAGDHGGDRLIEARVVAGQRHLPFFAAVRPVYNLLERDHEASVAPVAHAQDLGVFPRSPLAGDRLAGPRRRDRTLGRRGQRVLDALAEIARERSVAPASVALAWLATKPHVIAPIVAVRSQEQLAAALGSTGLHLTRAEATTLDRVSG